MHAQLRNFKADYFTLSDTDDISIDNRNEHYFDAEQDYSVDVKGVLSISVDADGLEKDQLTIEELRALAKCAPHNVEILETEVKVPGW